MEWLGKQNSQGTLVRAGQARRQKSALGHNVFLHGASVETNSVSVAARQLHRHKGGEACVAGGERATGLYACVGYSIRKYIPQIIPG